jgi:DNA-binding MarR family transcriptional regulator
MDGVDPLTPTERDILVCLHLRGGSTPKGISDVIGTAPSYTNTLLTGLENRQLVDSERAAKHLTPDGVRWSISLIRSDEYELPDGLNDS